MLSILPYTFLCSPPHPLYLNTFLTKKDMKG